MNLRKKFGTSLDVKRNAKNSLSRNTAVKVSPAPAGVAAHQPIHVSDSTVRCNFRRTNQETSTNNKMTPTNTTPAHLS